MTYPPTGFGLRESRGGSFARDFLAAVDLPRGARVLEIGPGPGWIGIILAEARPDLAIEAVEASPDMLRVYRAEIARRGLEGRIAPRLGRAEELKATTAGMYAAVFSRDSLHHWSDPAAAFAGIRARLAPGGSLFLRDCRRDIGPAARLVVALVGRAMPASMGKYWASSIAAGYTEGELRAFLRNVDFRAIETGSRFLDLEARAQA
jgi:SAM-dependent methyltransferase